MPVSPQAPITPSTTSRSNTGRTCSTKVEYSVMREAASAWRAMCSGSGTTFECRKNRSSRDSRKPGEAAFDRAPQDPSDRPGCSLAEIAFAGDPRTLGEPAGKRGADHLLRLAIAVARREVEQGNAGLDRFMYRGAAFRETGLAPQHAEPAAAKRQDRHRRQPTETVLPHLIDTPSYRVSVYASFRKLGKR